MLGIALRTAPAGMNGSGFIRWVIVKGRRYYSADQNFDPPVLLKADIVAGWNE